MRIFQTIFPPCFWRHRLPKAGQRQRRHHRLWLPQLLSNRFRHFFVVVLRRKLFPFTARRIGSLRFIFVALFLSLMRHLKMSFLTPKKFFKYYFCVFTLFFSSDLSSSSSPAACCCCSAIGVADCDELCCCCGGGGAIALSCELALDD